MSPVEIIGVLFAASAPLTAVVPATAMAAGALPQNVKLPAIVVNNVSRTDWSAFSRGKRHGRARVRATVAAPDYETQVRCIELMRRAGDNRQGVFAGTSDVDVQVSTEGPDIYDPEAGVWQQSLDFIVSWNEPL